LVLSVSILYPLGEPIIQQWVFEVYSTAHPVWVLWIALVIGAPLFEETFFRGFMFRGFQSSFLGLTGTTVTTSALWAVGHLQYDFYTIIDIGCFGVLLATARQMTGSLLMPLYLHALSNLCATVGASILQYSH
jgi:membrane protease YdiL (CAAX protease family)